jgi:hypothetical protein
LSRLRAQPGTAQTAEEVENLGAPQRTPDHDAAFVIDAMNLEH